MSKKGEVNYLKNLGEKGIIHAKNKPFSDTSCGKMLAELGAIMSLLPPPPIRLLDVGCGTGWTSCFFAKRGYNVVGIDISRDMIHYANINKNKEKLKNLHFIVKDYENMDFNNEFDCVIFFDSLHHSDNEEKAIKGAYKALKSRGICITSEPGTGHQKKDASINAMKKYGVTEKDMPPKKIVKIGKEAGFRKFKIYPSSNLINSILYSQKNKIIKFKVVGDILTMFRVIFKRYKGIVLMIK